MENKYDPVWERLEHSTSRPDRVRDVIQMDYQKQAYLILQAYVFEG